MISCICGRVGGVGELPVAGSEVYGVCMEVRVECEMYCPIYVYFLFPWLYYIILYTWYCGLW